MKSDIAIFVIYILFNFVASGINRALVDKKNVSVLKTFQYSFYFHHAKFHTMFNSAINQQHTTDVSELTYILIKETLTPLKARLGRNNLSDEPARSSELSPYVHANKAREAISVRVHATAQLFISTDQTAIPIKTTFVPELITLEIVVKNVL